MKTAKIGLIGLAVMGANLARNIASKGFDVAVHNRSPERTEAFLREHGHDRLFAPATRDLAAFVATLEHPRNIIVMVQAGKPVDAVISELLPLLEPGDCIIDCGNSQYRDTVRRGAELAEKNILFIGCGVSGGEEGALNGPSIMPGGEAESYERIRPILEKIAARDFDGKACVTHIGKGASGHYVKMVHNGIEYAVMQIMAEAYDALRKVYGLSAPQIADVFEKYSQGKLGSYLFDISLSVLRKQDDLADGHLIDRILDSAGQKGTGKWVAIDALERGIAVPTIAESVFARNISAMKSLRTEFSPKFAANHDKPDMNLEDFCARLEDALYTSILSAYAQGYDLIAQASTEENWGVNLAEVTRIWEGGCIIRAKILVFLHTAFLKAPEGISHIFAISEVADALNRGRKDWEEVIGMLNGHGIAIPAMSSALSYFVSMTDEKHPANYIQGLRDYFGAHTYSRTDREGVFHAEWGDHS